MKKNFFTKFHTEFGTRGVVLLVVLVLFVGGLGGVVLERLVLPYFSTWPVIRNISVLRPDTPIIITKREEIRILDGVNQVEVVNRVKNSLVTIYSHRGEFDSGSFRVDSTFTGIIVSNDGLILTPAVNVSSSILLTIITAGGDSYKAEFLAEDSLTGLAFLKVEAEGLAVLRQGFSENIKEGEQLIGVWSDENSNDPASMRVSISRPGTVKPSLVEVYSLNRLNAPLRVQWPEDGRVLGALLVNREAELMGLETLIAGRPVTVRGEDIKLLIDNFLDDKKITWPRLLEERH